MFRVIVTGDRNWKTVEDAEIVGGALGALKDRHGLDLLVIEGGAAGVDTLARRYCEREGIDVITCWANWAGRSVRQGERLTYYAGPFRNKLMLTLFEPVDLVVGFHRFIHGSKGTKDMLRIAMAANVRTRLLP